MENSQAASLILRNIESKGLYRYDPNDIDAYLFHHFGIIGNTPFRKAFRVADIFFPVFLRKILRIEKKATPTMFYHLGMALSIREKYGLPVPSKLTAAEMGKHAVSLYFHADTGLWADPYYARVTVPPSTVIQKEGVFSFAMHFVARLDILLLNLWRLYQDDTFLNIAAQSIEAAAKHHNVQDLGDGRKAISYYYNSLDNTLNISAEFLECIADLPANRRSPELTELADGLLQMLLYEQNPDGSFYYVGKSHMEKHHIPKYIDGFHTAYVLNNLLHVYHSDLFSGSQREALLECCQRGMAFYLEAFYQKDTGETCYALDLPTHKADSVCYSEGIVAFCTYLRSSAICNELKGRIRDLLPKAMAQMLAKMDPKDGSFASEYVLGREIKIDSIRWGSGPALQAIFDVMSLQQEGLLPL